MAIQLLKQVGATLESLNQLAWHRDVNPRNVMVSDITTGHRFDFQEGIIENVRFDLIDFGLAIDSRDWSSKWRTSSIAGDCRYWAISSWFMSFFGPKALEQREGLLRQYETELDSYALGVMALELLCTPALASCIPAGTVDSLRGSWRRLLTAWTHFRQDVSRWHRQVHEVFASGGDMKILYQRLAQERLPEQIQSHIVTLCSCLRACIDRAADPALQNLLWVIAELMDETSALDLRKAIKAVSGEGIYPLQPTPPTAQASSTQPAIPPASLERSVLHQASLPQLAPLPPSHSSTQPPAAGAPSPSASFTPLLLARGCVSQRSLSPPHLGASLTASAGPAASPRLVHRL